MSTATLPTFEQVNGVLLKAKALLEANGWHQGNLYDAESTIPELMLCPMCLVGAINAAVYGNPTFLTFDGDQAELRFAACRAVNVAIEVPFPGEISEWNDTDGRTIADVLAALDTAIAQTAGA